MTSGPLAAHLAREAMTSHPFAHLIRMIFMSDDERSTDDSDSGERFASFVDGVCRKHVENLIGVRSLLERPGGLILDTGVIAHHLDDPPQQTE
eukprot:10096687-Karenia_brevis.AAC.1